MDISPKHPAHKLALALADSVYDAFLDQCRAEIPEMTKDHLSNQELKNIAFESTETCTVFEKLEATGPYIGCTDIHDASWLQSPAMIKLLLLAVYMNADERRKNGGTYIPTHLIGVAHRCNKTSKNILLYEIIKTFSLPHFQGAATGLMHDIVEDAKGIDTSKIRTLIRAACKGHEDEVSVNDLLKDIMLLTDTPKEKFIQRQEGAPDLFFPFLDRQPSRMNEQIMRIQKMKEEKRVVAMIVRLNDKMSNAVSDLMRVNQGKITDPKVILNCVEQARKKLPVIEVMVAACVKPGYRDDVLMYYHRTIADLEIQAETLWRKQSPPKTRSAPMPIDAPQPDVPSDYTPYPNHDTRKRVSTNKTREQWQPTRPRTPTTPKTLKS